MVLVDWRVSQGCIPKDRLLPQFQKLVLFSQRRPVPDLDAFQFLQFSQPVYFRLFVAKIHFESL